MAEMSPGSRSSVTGLRAWRPIAPDPVLGSEAAQLPYSLLSSASTAGCLNRYPSAALCKFCATGATSETPLCRAPKSRAHPDVAEATVPTAAMARPGEDVQADRGLIQVEQLRVMGQRAAR